MNYERRIIERCERWHDIAERMPALHFDPSWQVKVIPPYAEAMARFVVTRGRHCVSVYADFYDRLGYVGEPYWEIYPGAENECDRFLLSETAQLLAAIEQSLKNMEAGDAA